VRVVAYNLSRQQTQIRLFETGRSFENSAGTINQINKMAGIVTGSSVPEQWGASVRPVDFHDLKGDVEALLDVLVPGAVVEFAPATVEALHPGQSAVGVAGGRPIARFGSLHPDLTKYFGIKQRVLVFEIDLDALPPAAIPVYVPLSKFPSVRRDLSLTLERSIPAAMVMASIREVAPAYLRELQLFDVYEGEGIDSGKKSLALGLIFQGLSSTLRDEDIDAQVAAIVKHLAVRLGAVLRDS
jgi:phenylalanyl-tRNA synthetase beta chain